MDQTQLIRRRARARHARINRNRRATAYALARRNAARILQRVYDTHGAIATAQLRDALHFRGIL